MVAATFSKSPSDVGSETSRFYTKMYIASKIDNLVGKQLNRTNSNHLVPKLLKVSMYLNS